MKFIFLNEMDRGWVVEAQDKHNAIAKAVEAGYSENMADFYYGLSDGQISVVEVEREISE